MIALDHHSGTGPIPARGCVCSSATITLRQGIVLMSSIELLWVGVQSAHDFSMGVMGATLNR
jgi:hypothetical protein